jgi:hypothetical protein
VTKDKDDKTSIGDNSVDAKEERNGTASTTTTTTTTTTDVPYIRHCAYTLSLVNKFNSFFLIKLFNTNLFKVLYRVIEYFSKKSSHYIVSFKVLKIDKFGTLRKVNKARKRV